jgi:serine/threonine protein kinase
MGEVYRAHDTKLGRAVAIKVLPEALATDADRVSRLEREAKVLAQLNHPHVAALLGMEVAGGGHFLVMELVEGDMLVGLAPAVSGTRDIGSNLTSETRVVVNWFEDLRQRVPTGRR